MAATAAFEAAELLARLPVAIYRTTPDGRLLNANQAFADLVGVTSVDEALDLDVRGLYADPADRDHMVDRVAAGVEVGPEEVMLRRVDGELIRVRVTSLGVHADDGAVQYYEGVLEDVTERWRSQHDLERSNALLGMLARAHNRFMAGSTIGTVLGDLLSDLLHLTECATGSITGLGPHDRGIGPIVYAAIGAGNDEVEQQARSVGRPVLTDRAVAIPIVRTDRVTAMVSLGSPRSPLEQSLLSFLEPVVGTIAGLLSAHRAELDRDSAELERKVGEERFRTVVEAANDTVVVYDASGVIAAANPAVWQVFGCPPHELLGRNILDLVPPDDPNRTSILTGSTGPLAVDLVRASGEHLPAEVSIGAATVDGRPVFTAVIRDMTEHRRAEETLRRAKEAAERVSRAKDEFLAAMSHELRTPLNGVIGLSTVLAREIHGPVNDKQAEYLAQIEASGRHLLSLINDVLDLAKIEAEKLEAEMAPTDLVTVAEEAIAIVREPAAAKGLVVELETTSAPQIDADARRTKQVIVNLLSNAVKFTDTGGRLGVKVRVADSHVVVEVWDTGIGIPADRFDDLFVPFKQIEGSLARVHEGTGLGLALSRKLVEMQGGEIYFESEVGEGSTFGFRLPISSPTASSSDSAEPGQPSPVTLTGRVLVVDDNDINRMLVSDYLAAHGLEVIEAADGDAAIEQAIEHVPDAIVMDIQMPRRDGLSATRELKSRAETAGIPILALTAMAMEGDADRCFEAGVDDYLSKPCDPETVREAVAKLISR